jgi:microsomal epoxide hydrolase
MSDSTDSREIRPFRLDVPQDQLDDLARRLAATRWPIDGPVSGWAQGMPREYAHELVEYWREGYDWHAQEALLNRHPQFLTRIFDHDVHFLHVRSAEKDALPLMLTHGWPGSIVEFLEVIGPLTDPAGHGGNRADAFHVVVPTIPGFGIPGPTTSEWTTRRVAEAWAELMNRLGYHRYAAHGGDYGSVISRHLGIVDRDHVVALHLTALLGSSARADSADPDDLEQQESLAKAQRYQRELIGYALLQSTRPQSLAYALTDSPVGQLAWIVERFKDWTDSTDRPEDAVDRDLLLTNVMIYWLFATAGSSARYYFAGAKDWGSPQEISSTPTAVALMPRDIARPARQIAEKTDNIVRWQELAHGGHFAALEQPELIVTDLREALRPYR